MKVAEFVRQLIDHITWQDSPLSIKIQSCYLKHLITRSETTIAELRAIDPQFSEALEILLGQIDSQTKKSFITSTIFASLVIMPSSLRDLGKRQFILKALMQKVAPENNYNSPLISKYHFKIANQDKTLFVSTNLLDDYRTAKDTLKILLNDIFPIPGIDRGGSNFSSVDSEQSFNVIIAKISDALNIINTSKAAVEFTLQSTELILIRKEKEFPNLFSSGSFRLMPGLSLLCNSELESVSIYKVANALLHEAIHGIIYKYETFGQRLIPKKYESSTDIKSPWTGRFLKPDSFIQACFVWFGLYMFWSCFKEGNLESDKLLEIAKAGFMSPVFQKSCEEICSRSSEGVCEQIMNRANLVK